MEGKQQALPNELILEIYEYIPFEQYLRDKSIFTILEKLSAKRYKEEINYIKEIENKPSDIRPRKYFYDNKRYKNLETLKWYKKYYLKEGEYPEDAFYLCDIDMITFFLEQGHKICKIDILTENIRYDPEKFKLIYKNRHKLKFVDLYNTDYYHWFYYENASKENIEKNNTIKSQNLIKRLTENVMRKGKTETIKWFIEQHPNERLEYFLELAKYTNKKLITKYIIKKIENLKKIAKNKV